MEFQTMKYFSKVQFNYIPMVQNYLELAICIYLQNNEHLNFQLLLRVYIGNAEKIEICLNKLF